ncbi:MAG TPA: 4Fe-4S binding protein [Bacillota bacterium]|jgi:ferredoxin|nr:4Fe-4S binding protein [Bacillota bacterium]HOA34712.1 4Fe-4S binding protein [Bacillota bacterium]HOJ84330.1 4Fe-4S binding protein [Bacillota bacterium]HOL15887.1 4Fe-4S binding protein [Bacillota bacterium]HPZ11180.1 4Fe-4S binding protein [Bacillota bacterium]
MAIKQKLVFRFPPSVVEQPFIYRLVRDFDLMVNILRADINPDKEGRLMLELSGSEPDYRRAIEWLKQQGVRILNLKQQITWNEDRCTHCGACSVICPSGALELSRPAMTVTFDESKCIVCELCLKACPARAMKTLLEQAR